MLFTSTWVGNTHLVAGGLAGEEGFHLVESVHQVIEDWRSFCTSILTEDFVCAFCEGVALSFGQIVFRVLRVRRNRGRWGSLSLRRHVNDAWLLHVCRCQSRPTRTLRKPPVPGISSPHSGSAANHCDDIRSLDLAEDACGAKVGGRFDDRLHL